MSMPIPIFISCARTVPTHLQLMSIDKRSPRRPVLWASTFCSGDIPHIRWHGKAWLSMQQLCISGLLSCWQKKGNSTIWWWLRFAAKLLASRPAEILYFTYVPARITAGILSASGGARLGHSCRGQSCRPVMNMHLSIYTHTHTVILCRTQFHIEHSNTHTLSFLLILLSFACSKASRWVFFTTWLQ